jgi:hypothetical protein
MVTEFLMDRREWLERKEIIDAAGIAMDFFGHLPCSRVSIGLSQPAHERIGPIGHAILH